MFDNANRQACTVKVSRTNTPLQALTLLNDPTFVEAARALAVNTTKQHFGTDPRQQIDTMMRRVLLRPGEPRELDVLEKAYLRESDWFKQHPNAAKKYLGVGEFDSHTAFDATHIAALASVAQTIMNLDEALNKE